MGKEVDIHNDMDVCCLATGFVQKLSQKWHHIKYYIHNDLSKCKQIPRFFWK